MPRGVSLCLVSHLYVLDRRCMSYVGTNSATVGFGLLFSLSPVKIFVGTIYNVYNYYGILHTPYSMATSIVFLKQFYFLWAIAIDKTNVYCLAQEKMQDIQSRRAKQSNPAKENPDPFVRIMPVRIHL